VLEVSKERKFIDIFT